MSPSRDPLFDQEEQLSSPDLIYSEQRSVQRSAESSLSSVAIPVKRARLDGGSRRTSRAVSECGNSDSDVEYDSLDHDAFQRQCSRLMAKVHFHSRMPADTSLRSGKLNRKRLIFTPERHKSLSRSSGNTRRKFKG